MTSTQMQLQPKPSTISSMVIALVIVVLYTFVYDTYFHMNVMGDSGIHISRICKYC